MGPGPPLLPRLPAYNFEHVEALLERLGLGRLIRPVPARLIWALYVFVNGFLTIALLALLAAVTRVPMVFPSLGPTAYLLFFSPRSESASPHNTILGHAIGLISGYAAFWAMGMPGSITGPHDGLVWPRVFAAALSLAGTGALMILLNASHPPAGATTLIVSLGIIARPGYLVVIEAAGVLLTIQAFCINRLAGLPYPMWKDRSG